MLAAPKLNQTNLVASTIKSWGRRWQHFGSLATAETAAPKHHQGVRTATVRRRSNIKRCLLARKLQKIAEKYKTLSFFSISRLLCVALARVWVAVQIKKDLDKAEQVGRDAAALEWLEFFTQDHSGEIIKISDIAK